LTIIVGLMQGPAIRKQTRRVWKDPSQAGRAIDEIPCMSGAPKSTEPFWLWQRSCPYPDSTSDRPRWRRGSLSGAASRDSRRPPHDVPRTAELWIGTEAGQQIIRHRRNRVVSTQGARKESSCRCSSCFPRVWRRVTPSEARAAEIGRARSQTLWKIDAPDSAHLEYAPFPRARGQVYLSRGERVAAWRHRPSTYCDEHHLDDWSLSLARRLSTGASARSARRSSWA
jgi:hypothetical protein